MATGQAEKLSLSNKRTTIREILKESLTGECTATYSEADEWNEAFKLELAAHLKPTLNQHIKTVPQNSRVEMQHVDL